MPSLPSRKLRVTTEQPLRALWLRLTGDTVKDQKLIRDYAAHHGITARTLQSRLEELASDCPLQILQTVH